MYDYKSKLKRITLNNNNLKNEIMKTLNQDLTKSIFDEFVLSNDEMINVRGGELDPTPLPTTPPIKI